MYVCLFIFCYFISNLPTKLGLLGRYHSIVAWLHYGASTMIERFWSAKTLHADMDRKIEKIVWEWKKKQRRTARGQEQQKVSGPPRENAIGKQRCFYILLTHSKSLDPGIAPWGSPPHSYFEHTRVVVQRRPGQEMQQTKYTTASPDYYPQCSVYTTRTQTEAEDQQDVFCSPSGWVCLALVRTSWEKNPRNHVYLFLRINIPGWHFTDIRGSQK